MGLKTPEKIGKLQRTLYAKAKEQPERRFHQLYDKVWREDFLEFAYRKCKANGGAAGVDRESFEDIEAGGREKWLGELARELKSKSYRPAAVRRVWIDKGNGGKAPAGSADDQGSGGANGGDVSHRADLRGRSAAGTTWLPPQAKGAGCGSSGARSDQHRPPRGGGRGSQRLL